MLLGFREPSGDIRCIVPERIGKKGTGKIKVTLDTDKLPKFGLTTATVYLSRFPGDKVGEENAIPVSAVLLPDFSHISQQQRLNPPAVELSTEELTLPPLAENEKKSAEIETESAKKAKPEKAKSEKKGKVKKYYFLLFFNLSDNIFYI